MVWQALLGSGWIQVATICNSETLRSSILKTFTVSLQLTHFKFRNAFLPYVGNIPLGNEKKNENNNTPQKLFLALFQHKMWEIGFLAHITCLFLILKKNWLMSVCVRAYVLYCLGQVTPFPRASFVISSILGYVGRVPESTVHFRKTLHGSIECVWTTSLSVDMLRVCKG